MLTQLWTAGGHVVALCRAHSQATVIVALSILVLIEQLLPATDRVKANSTSQLFANGVRVLVRVLYSWARTRFPLVAKLGEVAEEVAAGEGGEAPGSPAPPATAPPAPPAPQGPPPPPAGPSGLLPLLLFPLLFLAVAGCGSLQTDTMLAELGLSKAVSLGYRTADGIDKVRIDDFRAQLEAGQRQAAQIKQDYDAYKAKMHQALAGIDAGEDLVEASDKARQAASAAGGDWKAYTDYLPQLGAMAAKIEALVADLKAAVSK
jgi:hypothetical protein